MPFFWRLNDGERGSSPEELFRQIPPVSKFIICSMVATMISPVVGINPSQFYLIWSLVWNKFHIWRLVSCFLYPGPPALATIWTVYIAGMFSVRYEKDGFSTGGGGGSADFAFMLLFGSVVTVTIMLLLFFRPVMVLVSIMIYYISYVWSRKNPNTSVSIWGVLISTPYVPWVMLALDWITKNDIFHPLMGIAVGHLYYFLVDVLPDLHGIDLLKTPAFLVRLLGWGNEGSGVYVSAPAPGAPAPGSGREHPRGSNPRSGPRSWGTGRPLGSS